MKSAQIIRGMVMCLAAMGLCLSGAAIAGPPASQPVVHDIALGNGGMFSGQLVDAQSVAKAGEKVMLLYESRPLITVATDERGNFRFPGLRGGMYQLVAAGSVENYRLWTPGTAPKGVPSRALVVCGDPIIRGAQPGYRYGYQQGLVPSLPPARFLLGNPWVVMGITATAVGVPVGIAAAEEDRPPASP